jgi:REP element-mobilizing transposase RayT
MRRRQPHLPGFGKLSVKEFGGTALKGNPREARPLSAKRPVHLVMRSRLAVGPRSFLKRERQIQALVQRLARQKGVKLYRFANAGNHLHFLLLVPSRREFRAYVRAVSGIVARITLQAERGRAQAEKFWDARPFTRIVEWGRDFQSVCRYVMQNTLEALGFIPYQERKTRAPPRYA